MRQATQARLNAAQNNGRVLVRASNEVAVHRCGVVGAPIGRTARRIGILAAWNLVYSVMIHHGIHIARRNKEAQARLAEHIHAFGVAPVGLRDNAHLIAVRLEHARNNRHAEQRLVDVRIAAHVGKIDAIPPASPHIVHIYRKKCAARRVMYDGMLLAASANVARSTLPSIFRLSRRILRIPAGAFASRLARALLLGTPRFPRFLCAFAPGASLLVLGSIRQTRALVGPAFYTAMVVLPRHYFEASSEVELSAISATIESALERCSMPES